MLLLLALACRGPSPVPPEVAAGTAVRTGGGPGMVGPQVRHRPSEPDDASGRWLVASVPGARWDAGLARAAEDLLSLATARNSVLDPAATSLACARAGFPGQARFARVLTGGALPADVLDQVATGPVDVALASRRYGDGTVLWIVGWAPHLAELTPVPRDLPLDATMPLRVDLDEPAELRLFLAPPDSPVEELSLTPGVSRWLDLFHSPGEHRLEVVARRAEQAEVLLLFSLFVDGPPPEPRPLSAAPTDAPDPRAAETELVAALQDLRTARGLRPVEPFSMFLPFVREHSALMAATGQVAHTIAGVTPGVAERAAAVAHPRARHYEDVAAADSAADAMALVASSPGHLRNLLCEACDHVAIGVALEPTTNRRPRLFVTWELLEFPDGEPLRLDRFERLGQPLPPG